MDLTRIEIDAATRETFWIGDPDIDQAMSDVDLWVRTGDGLVPREKSKPSVIRRRPLLAPERAEVRAWRGSYFGFCSLCCAYGLQSIDGLELGTERDGIMRRIGQRGLSMFDAIGAAYQHMTPAMDLSTKRNVVGDDGKPLMIPLSPIEWLGGVISAASFRDGD